MFQLALVLLFATLTRAIEEVTTKHVGVFKNIKGFWIPHPIDEFLECYSSETAVLTILFSKNPAYLAGYKVNIWESKNRIKKPEESLLSVRPAEKPCRMEE